jgi:phosphonate transport system substrate-binding protein
MKRHHAEETKITRRQDAVPFDVENGSAACGASAAKGVVKSWQAAGAGSCSDSRPVTLRPRPAAARTAPATAEPASDILLNFSQTDIGKKALAAASYRGFIPPSVETEMRLTAWWSL